MSALPTSILGRTGLEVTKLGYGAMELRGPDDGRARVVTPAEADGLLNAVLDAGINYIDTSPDYGVSEEHIGRAISHRRDEFFLASKCGCPVEPGARGHVFTRTNIRAGVEQSLRRMKTDHLDVVQFHHNPSRATLEEHDAVGELDDLRAEGKVRFVGVSGTDPNLARQIAMGVFDVFQIPYSALERDHEDAITAAAETGAGVVIRGGVARGVPDPDARPVRTNVGGLPRHAEATQGSPRGRPRSTTSATVRRQWTSCCGSRSATRTWRPRSSAPQTRSISPPTSRRRAKARYRQTSTKRRGVGSPISSVRPLQARACA